MSIIEHITLQKIVAHDFRYDSRKFQLNCRITLYMHLQLHTAPTKTAVPDCLHIKMITTEYIFII